MNARSFPAAHPALRTAAALLLSWTTFGTGVPTASAESTTTEFELIPGVEAQGTLGEGAVHVYRADLGAGVWRLTIQQDGVDVVAEVELPDGTELGPYNSPTSSQGTESFLVTVERPGVAKFALRPFLRRASTQPYATKIEYLAPASHQDRSFLEQQQILAELAATSGARSYAARSTAEARDHYRRALSLWPETDTIGRARVLVALAVLNRALDESGEAAKLYRSALDLWQRVGAKDEEAVTQNRLGLVLNELGETVAARACFEQALDLWKALGRPKKEIPPRLNLCLALQRQGSFEDARGCYEEALHLVRRLGLGQREAQVLNNLAGVLWKLGEPEEALAHQDQALARLSTAGDSFFRSQLLTSRARFYLELGEPERALLDLGETLAIFRRQGRSREQGRALSHLGLTYLDLGQFDRARIYLEQALPLRRDAEDLRGVAETLRTLGQVHGHLGEEGPAAGAFDEALELSQRLEDRRGEATLLLLLGRFHADAGGLNRAAAELHRAAELHGQLGDRRQESQALLELGKVRYRQGDLKRGLDLLQKARTEFQQLQDPGEEGRTLEALARIERDQGRLGAALESTAAAIELLEDLRTKTGGLRQRAAFLSTRRSIYELHVDLLMQRHLEEPETGHDRRAFAVSERARSRALLDSIQAEAQLDEGLRLRLRTATRRLAGLTARQVAIQGQAHNADEITRLDQEVVGALAELEAVRAEARRNLTGDTAPAETITGAADAAALLDPGTLFLEYLLSEPRSFLFAIDSGSVSSYELPGRSAIEALARRAYADLSTPDLRTGRTSREALETLEGWLLAPVADQLAENRRLAIVADGALHYLPFAAFWQPGGNEPLVVSHDITHLPSASILAQQRRLGTPRKATKTLAVLADPVFEAFDPRLPGSIAPQADPTPSTDAMTRVRGALGSLGRLTATAEEAEAILALVPEPSDRVLVQGFDAHRDWVLEGELADYRYLHFATHGLLNDRHPDLSGLVLAQFDSHGRTRNGFLGLDDVYGLDLSAEMVVLSGCQTALGREMRGEGLLGPTRGFMTAGVPRVVASLWPVQDAVTARLMGHFYRGILEEGKTPSEALAAAQRSIRGRRAEADPFFWSAFVLLGEWR